MKRFLLLILMVFFTPLCAYKYDFTVCSIFQNEAPYLKEWIDYNISIGVDHFILYNNNSTDNYKDVLKPYVNKKIVKLIEWPSIDQEKEHRHFSFVVQTGAYNDAIKRSKDKSKWLALIDTDEFIISIKYKSVFKTLEKEYKKFSGVCVNWQCYGTSNVWLRPKQSMIKSLLYKLPTNHPKNLYYKSIVRPDHVEKCQNPHFCWYTEGHFHVNGIREKITVENTGVYIDTLRINHYWARDERFLHDVKIPRYEKWGTPAEKTLEAAAEMNQVFDPIILSNSR